VLSLVSAVHQALKPVVFVSVAARVRVDDHDLVVPDLVTPYLHAKFTILRPINLITHKVQDIQNFGRELGQDLLRRRHCVHLYQFSIWQESEVLVIDNIVAWPVLGGFTESLADVEQFANVHPIEPDSRTVLDHVLPAWKLIDIPLCALV
jgi:hypothetical protein